MSNESIWLQAGFLPLFEGVCYYPKGENPLSAEVFLIPGKENIWFFDAGNGEGALRAIRSIPGRKKAVISHFHPDHMGNALHAGFEQVYLGDFAFRKAQDKAKCICVTEKIEIEDGVSLCILPLPSSHAKGSLMLEAGKLLFLGDGTYSTMKNGKKAYNATVLRETLQALKETQAEYVVQSHREPLIALRQEVMGQMQSIYEKREKNQPYILL